MLKNKRKITYILILITLITIGSIFYFSKRLTLETKQKCPDDYAKTESGEMEYKIDFDRWANDFFDSNPKATLTDWSNARYQFWVDNNCKETLERYQEGLNSKDPNKMKLINDTIEETINHEE